MCPFRASNLVREEPRTPIWWRAPAFDDDKSMSPVTSVEEERFSHSCNVASLDDWLVQIGAMDRFDNSIFWTCRP